MAKRYVIIGASAAGVSAASRLRMLDKDAEITCLTQELDIPYNKCLLADYLAGEIPFEKLLIKPYSFFEEQKISLQLGVQVTGIDPVLKKVSCSNGELIAYDALLLALGGSVQRPAIHETISARNVLTFYTLYDTQSLLKAVQSDSVKRVLIIGAGLSGLECADSITEYVETVTLIERESHLLFRQIPLAAAQFIQEKMTAQAVQVVTGAIVNRFHFVQEHITGALLSNGKNIEVDLVVYAFGARPNGWIARKAGLAVEGGAIVTDEYLRSSNSAIFAAGDVALVKDKLTGMRIKSSSWPDAIRQGAVAASNMTGLQQVYPGTTTVVSSSFFGMKFFLCGQLKEPCKRFHVKLQKSDEEFRLIVSENGVVKGFLLIGRTHHLSALRQSLLTGRPCDPSLL